MISGDLRSQDSGRLSEGRFFDRARRTVKQYLQTVEYLPRNPVRRGLVKHAEEGKGSSVRESAQAALVFLGTCH